MAKHRFILVLLLGLIIAIGMQQKGMAVCQGESEPVRFNLETALSYALEHNPLLMRTHFDQDRSELLIKDVKARLILPVFSLSGQSGFVPEARGDIFDSPDKQTDLDGWGPFYKLDVKIIQPLFTFGRNSASLKAARHANDLQGFRNKVEVEKLKHSVVQAYWALSSARKAQKIADDLRGDYAKLQEEVEERLRSEDSEVDDADLLEVKSNRFYIEEIQIKSSSEGLKAEKAFNTLIGRDTAMKIEVLDEPSPEIMLTEDQISEKIDFFMDKHPNIQSLNTTLQTLHSKIDLEYAKKKPIIFLAGGVSYGYAPKREDQTNPFALDNFNYFGLGAFVGMEWNLNFMRKNIQANRYKLQEKSLEQDLKLLQAQIKLEILRIYTQTIEEWKLLSEARDSLKSSKSWVRLSLDNWEMGVGEVDRIIRAYNMYYRLKSVEIEREFRLNSSLANLAHALGDMGIYLRWMKNEKVQLD